MQHFIVELFLWLFGLCVGSFLNVVVYRLTVGLSVTRPLRSFCPACKAHITWYDNLPVISWFLLGGRCRQCGRAISPQYPVVEALTGLGFVLVYHLLFVSRARVGLPAPVLPGDLPLLLSWLTLTAGLIACAAMDIVSYSIDIRVTNVVLGLGIVLHALWPSTEFCGETASSAMGAATSLAGIVALFMLWRSSRHEIDDDVQQQENVPANVAPAANFRAGMVAALALVLIAGWLMVAAFEPGVARIGGTDLPVATALVAAFGVIVLIGGQTREVDQEIEDVLDEEQPQARWMALREVVWLLPMTVLGTLAYLARATFPAVEATWQTAVHWSPIGDLTPVAGVAFAIHGAMIGAVAGWIVRIVFTLAFGREAFGTGDIFILAAAGATAGADITILGLLLSIGLALAGVIIGLLLKRTAVIPLGPWLALGLLLALHWNKPAARIGKHYLDQLTYAWERRPELLLAAGGVMLVVFPASIALSRLLRRMMTSESQ